MASRIKNSRADRPDNNLVQTIFWFWIVLLVPGVLLLAAGVYLSFPYPEIAVIVGLILTLAPGYYYLIALLEKRRAITSSPSHLAVITACVPEEVSGDISSEVTGRGGQIIVMETQDGICEIRAQVPVSSMGGFESWLTKVTFGRGSMKRVDVLKSEDA